VSIVVESGIEIDLTHARNYVKHDDVNRIWPGVDFVIDNGAETLWLELKNWEPFDLPPHRRGGQRRSFLCKMRSNVFFRETLLRKFLGTTAYMSFTGAMPTMPVVYIILLESPKLDSALRLHANNRMRELLRPHAAWTPAIRVAVLNVADWNALYPQYPARTL
jgi:hypothetical protein